MSMDRIVDLVRRKRDSEELSFEDYEKLISSYARGEVKEYQMAALLMAGCCTGFTDEEATALTSAMLKCGERLDLTGIDKPKVDKKKINKKIKKIQENKRISKFGWKIKINPKNR